jgi:hypothetical protein
MSKNSNRRYLERTGFIQPKPKSFSRSEEGNRYEYDSRIAGKFAGWSSVQRNAGKTPMFKEFYHTLDQDDKALVTVTEVFKNTL